MPILCSLKSQNSAKLKDEEGCVSRKGARTGRRSADVRKCTPVSCTDQPPARLSRPYSCLCVHYFKFHYNTVQTDTVDRFFYLWPLPRIKLPVAAFASHKYSPFLQWCKGSIRTTYTKCSIFIYHHLKIILIVLVCIILTFYWYFLIFTIIDPTLKNCLVWIKFLVFFSFSIF